MYKVNHLKTEISMQNKSEIEIKKLSELKIRHGFYIKKHILLFLCLLTLSVSTSFAQIDENLSYTELQSKAIDYYRKDSLDKAVILMEYAHKKFPENEIQSINILGLLYTRVGKYPKAIAIWKEGIDKGFSYNLNSDRFQGYYKDNVAFAELAKIEKDRNDASHIKYEVVLPTNYNKNISYPTLFIFHGNNRNIEKSKLSWASETMKENYISVFVQSYIYMTKETYKWVPDDDKTNKEFKEIYDSIMLTYAVDTNKIIFAGMSAGGKKVVEYAFNEFIPMNGLVLNCPVIPTDIDEESIEKFIDNNKRIGIITGETDFALEGQKKLLNDIDSLNGTTKITVNENLGHVFSSDFSTILDEYLKWVIE